MNLDQIAVALNAPPNGAVLAGLGYISDHSGLDGDALVAALLDPANREVLDLVRAGADAMAMAARWDNLHPALASGEQAAQPVGDPLADQPEPGPEPVTIYHRETGELETLAAEEPKELDPPKASPPSLPALIGLLREFLDELEASL